MALSLGDVKSYLGEGFHTALRKATDSTEAHAAWQAIQRMDEREWDAVVEFVAAPLMDYIRANGLQDS